MLQVLLKILASLVILSLIIIFLRFFVSLYFFAYKSSVGVISLWSFLGRYHVSTISVDFTKNVSFVFVRDCHRQFMQAQYAEP